MWIFLRNQKRASHTIDTMHNAAFSGWTKSLVMAYNLLGFNVYWVLMIRPSTLKKKILLAQNFFMINPGERGREEERERVWWRRSGGEKWRQWHQWVFRLPLYFHQLRSSGYALFGLSLLMENSVLVFVCFLIFLFLFVFGLLLTLLETELHLFFFRCLWVWYAQFYLNPQ